MHAILGAADVLGDPGFYRRLGFEPSTACEITPPPGCAACSPTPNPSTGPETLIGHDLTMPERQRRVVRYGVLMTTKIQISALFLVRPEVSEVEDHPSRACPAVAA